MDSFYHLPAGLLPGKACNGTACFVARHLNPAVWNAAANQSPHVYCLGQCFSGPASAGSLKRPSMEAPSTTSVVLKRLLHGGARPLSTYRARGGYLALETALRMRPQDVFGAVEASGLRGRGGAGFPTGRKWRSAAEQFSNQKYIVANADEGDPGAFIDRYLLEDDPHAVIEGMLLAAYAVGATHGWVYLRSEYPEAGRVMQQALSEARDANILGPACLGNGHSFDIQIHSGGGSYVCGEETALMRSLEGLRPEVMARPPYATERGLFGKPTVINNLETLATVPWIILNGPDAYHQLGFSKSRGTKVLSLNSLFQRPGLYEVEFGVSLRYIVEEVGGGLREGATLKGVIVGGPLAGIVPPHLLDTPLGFEEMQDIGASVGHGGVIAFDTRTSIAELMHHTFSFGAFESCGKCTPCRIGSRRVEEALSGLLAGATPKLWELQKCAAIVEALRWTSLCGLGTGLAKFAESALHHYGKELQSCP